MKKVRMSIEFAFPDIQPGMPKEENEMIEEARRLFPGKILSNVMQLLDDAGVEIMSFQKQSVEDHILIL